MNPRVLMIGWELPPFNSGGLGEACLGLAKALSKKGVKITFVLPQKVDINVDFMDVVFADIEDSLKMMLSSYVTYSEWAKQFGTDGKNINPFDFLGGALEYAEKIGKIARRCNFDLVHSHDWLTFPAGIVAKKLSNKPFVTHVHQTEMDRTGGHNLNPIVYNIEKVGMEKADKVISVSQFTKNILVNNYAIDPNKITVVHNGIEEISRKRLPPALAAMKKLNYKLVLFLGRITLMKGPEYFVRAAKTVLEHRPKTIFVVVGSGDMQEQMMAEAGNLGIMDNFLFTGFLRGEEKNRIWQSADLFVIPSVSEPFGITALESIANGTPVLLSKQSGVAEVLSHVLKVDFWDTDEMANKIISVLAYPSLKKVLKQESSKELPLINWDKSADKCIGIYRSIQENHGF